MDESRDPNKERAGKYRDPITEEVISIEGPDLGTYRIRYEGGRIQPLGTTVSEDDVKGLVRITE